MHELWLLTPIRGDDYWFRRRVKRLDRGACACVQF
jgi:hypothetical protein